MTQLPSKKKIEIEREIEQHQENTTDEMGKQKRRPPLQQMRRQLLIHPLPLCLRMEHNMQCQLKINQMIHQLLRKSLIYLQE
jgi:hypothetical protein